jgi:hypothetical protein
MEIAHMTTTLKTALSAATKSGTINLDNPALAIDLALSIPDAGMAIDFLRDWKAGKPLDSWLEMLEDAIEAEAA